MKHDWRGEQGVEFEAAKRSENIPRPAVEFRIAPTRNAFVATLSERRIP